MRTRPGFGGTIGKPSHSTRRPGLDGPVVDESLQIIGQLNRRCVALISSFSSTSRQIVSKSRVMVGFNFRGAVGSQKMI